MELYPLRFLPIFKSKIWGGNRLNQKLNKNTNGVQNVGESWEISSVPGDLSIILNGALSGLNIQEVISKYKEKLVGTKVFKNFGTNFPLLVKFIDANDYLSIQVHPDDKMAKERHNSYGKTEMWYIVDSEPDAELIVGFNQPMDKQKYLKQMNEGTLKSVLNFEKVRVDDVFYLPAGRIHATGSGILFAEIQQTSDITYRIYDWDRKDEQGHQRELHVDLALDAIDYRPVENYKTNFKRQLNKANALINCEYFTCNQLLISRTMVKDYSKIDSFVILMALDGDAEMYFANECQVLKKGETILIPACLNTIRLNPVGELTKLLEVFVA